jgi:predicted small metal-binding protein
MDATSRAGGEEKKMVKVIRCVCGFVANGSTDEELVEEAQKHIDSDHPELADKVSESDLLAMIELVA